MKEITRIHLAKVAYDIELDAKKEIQKYTSALERYTDDAELLEDIEIRMTELLAERGVVAGGVITKDDISAIRSQLGEPSDFLPDDAGDIAVGASIDSDSSRRLFRDMDGAILGGVNAGIARYFGINSLWVRLIFIILLFVSFGTVALVYIVLWLVVPPARTAAEKLQSAGQPVTLGSIRELNAQVEHQPNNRTPFVMRRVLLAGLGVLSTLAALAALAATVMGIIAVVGIRDGSLFGHWSMDAGQVIAGVGGMDWLLFGLLVFGGILLTLLFSLVSYMAFTGKATKRLVTSGIIIIVLGVITGIGAIGTGVYRGYQINSAIARDMRSTTVALPQMNGVKRIKVDMRSGEAPIYLPVDYIVDKRPRYELYALPSTKPVVTVEGDTATITVKFTQKDVRNYLSSSRITVYGPALDEITVASGEARYENSTPQEKMTAKVIEGNLAVLGSFNTVVTQGGSIDITNSTVTNLDASMEPQGSVFAGVVRSLTVSQPDACPSSSREDAVTVEVSAVTSGIMRYNGQEMKAATHRTPCGSVLIGSQRGE